MPRFVDHRLVARRRAANPHVLDADAGEQLQPLLRRGNLHSSLGGQFQFNRRRGMRDRGHKPRDKISSRNQAEFHSASIALQCDRLELPTARRNSAF